MDHDDGHCSCRSSDRTAVYVHELALMLRELMLPLSDGGTTARSTKTNERLHVEPCL